MEKIAYAKQSKTSGDHFERGEPCDGGDTVAQIVSAHVSALTAAERRVLACVSLAQTNKEIVNELKISPATVKRHLENILRKLKLRNRVEAAISGLLIENCPHPSSGCALLKWWNGRGKQVGPLFHGPIGP